ncbi:MAG TPA: hypothetical protein VFA00_12165 [Actinomycetota bacterium]|jgi:hypothetical protein|nr:hypothetical protein [Actinomycetota bacterium]
MELDLDDRDLARILLVARVAVGSTCFLFPRKAVQVWTGEDQESGTAAMAVRALGARDVAIGMGGLRALEEGESPSRWLEAGALSDAADTVGALAVFRSLGKLRRLLFVATAASATYLGFRLAASLDD